MTPACHSGRLWSLLEIMNHFKAWRLAYCVGKFATYQKAFRGPATVPTDNKTVVNFLENLQIAVKAFKASGMREASDRMTDIAEHILSSRVHVAAVLGDKARTARQEMVLQLKKRKFLRVATDRASYLDKDDLFGAEVSTAFRSARRDVREAGNCLAAEVPTAAVFHLMRASEIALRALAVDRGVQYPNATVESKQVGDLLVALDAKVKDLRNTAASTWPSKEVMDAQIKFYAEAVLHFRGFNEAWRKHMAHAHEGAMYDRDVAHSVFGHVRSLMQLLATKISETSITQKFWTAA
jgi:hypothetical protein